MWRRSLPGIDLNDISYSSLEMIILFHIVAKPYPSQFLRNGYLLPSLAGNLPITIDGGVIKAGGARIITADILTKNGIIHQIDSVMIPPGAVLPNSNDESIEKATTDFVSGGDGDSNSISGILIVGIVISTVVGTALSAALYIISKRRRQTDEGRFEDNT